MGEALVAPGSPRLCLRTRCANGAGTGAATAPCLAGGADRAHGYPQVPTRGASPPGHPAHRAGVARPGSAPPRRRCPRARCASQGGVPGGHQCLGPYSAARWGADPDLQSAVGGGTRLRVFESPLFLASSVFVKKPRHIMALSFVMVLCLLVYRLAEVRVRQRLAATQQTVPDQLRRPTTRPTMRWLFQCFEGIDLHHLTWPMDAPDPGLTPQRRASPGVTPPWTPLKTAISSSAKVRNEGYRQSCVRFQYSKKCRIGVRNVSMKPTEVLPCGWKADGTLAVRGVRARRSPLETYELDGMFDGPIGSLS